MSIRRTPEEFSSRQYDVIVIGGGVYGAMLALEAVFRGLTPLLLERGDFGGATSFNSLRTIHGGLRYLQSADIVRHLQSVRERRWFMANFPDLVKPLACLMPLYGEGLKRPSTMRVALALNDLLSFRRNVDVLPEQRIHGGEVLSVEATKRQFPLAREQGLKGGALWYDGAVPDSQRVIIELLRWSAAHGADLTNYMEVVALDVRNGRLDGVRAVDRETGAEHRFEAPVVINAAGPWATRLAGVILETEQNWSCPSLAWNVLTRRKALSRAALAVAPARKGALTYFLHPFKGRLLFGTGHAAWNGSPDNPGPSGALVRAMLDDINLAIPGLDLEMRDIDRVFPGLLPATGPGSAAIATNPTIVDHSQDGGPVGFFSVAGVKFTTARQVAATVLNKIFSQGRPPKRNALVRPDSDESWKLAALNEDLGNSDERWLGDISHLISNESATNLRDIVFRRTALWESPARANEIASQIGDMFAWPEQRKNEELAMLAQELNNHWSVDR